MRICHESCVFRGVRRQDLASRLAIRRNPVIKKSRATTVVAAQAGIAPSGTSEIKAAAIMILSTSGPSTFRSS